MRGFLANRWREIVALLGYGSLTAVYLRWLLALGRDHVLDLGDSLFNLSVVTWVADRVPHALAGVWDAPWFFPTRHALALSDHLIGAGVAMAILRPIVGGEIPAYNLIFFLAFALSGWTAFLLFRQLELSPRAAFFGGAIWTFLPFRWDEANHLQVLLTAFVPLLLLSFHRLLAEPNGRRAALFVAVYALHLSGGTYLAVMAHVPLAVLAVLALPGLWRRRGDHRIWLALIPAALGCVAVAGALLLPYRDGLAQIRSEADYRIWGATAISLLQPSPTNWYGDIFPPVLLRRENCLFVGFSGAFLIPVGLWAWARDGAAGAAPRRRLSRFLLGAVGAGLVAASVVLGDARTWLGLQRAKVPFGTVGLKGYERPAHLLVLGLALGLAASWESIARARARRPLEVDLLLASAVALLFAFPVVFTHAASVLPGFSGMRVPARFFVFASLGMAALAARGYAAVERWAGGHRWARALPALLVALLALEAAPRDLGSQPLAARDAQPEPATWLRQHDEVRAVIFLPLPPSYEIDREIARMWSARAHGRAIANGYSGTFPPEYRRLQSAFSSLPPAGEPALLAAQGISHLVIDFREADASVQSPLYHWLADREAAGWLRNVFEQDGLLIYEIAARPG